MRKNSRKFFRIFLLAAMLCSIFVLSTTASAAAKNGIKSENGKLYYYVNGKKVVNKYGVKVGNKYYRIDKSGVAKQVSEVYGLAGIYVEKNNRSLGKCFLSISKMKYRNVPTSSAIQYATYGFKTGAGNCNVQACSFYFCARVMGLRPYYEKGYVKSGSGYGKHAWVTMTFSGKKYVFDPSLAQHYYLMKNLSTSQKLSKMKLCFKFRYGTKGTYRYYDSHKKVLN